jgi:hypothetical protein
MEDLKFQLEFAIIVSFKSQILMRDTGPDLLSGNDVPLKGLSHEIDFKNFD